MKIRDAFGEFANNLSDQDDRPPPMVRSTTDAEATSAVESVAEDAPYENLPVLSKEDLPPRSSEFLGNRARPEYCFGFLYEVPSITYFNAGKSASCRAVRLDRVARDDCHLGADRIRHSRSTLPARCRMAHPGVGSGLMFQFGVDLAADEDDHCGDPHPGTGLIQRSQMP
jgi:hypothetical protein